MAWHMGYQNPPHMPFPIGGRCRLVTPKGQTRDPNMPRAEHYISHYKLLWPVD